MQKELTHNPHLRNRMSYIDALRGMACLWVLIHHSLEKVPADNGWFHYPFQLLVYVANSGWLGVNLFLVLSGFCLTYPLALKYPINEIKLDKKEFFQRRLRRILPPYYAAMLFSLSIPYLKYAVKNRSLDGIETAIPFKEFTLDIVSHIFMFHNFFVETFANINGAFWSLALEVQLYFLFPILLFIAKKRNIGFVLSVTFVIAFAWQIVAFKQQGLSVYWTREAATIYHALPARCFEFVLGMLAAYLVARPMPNQARYASILIGILILPLSYFVLFVSRFGPGLDPLWGIVFASLLILLHRVPEKFFQEVKALRYMTWFGGISYSVYLIHQPLYGLMKLKMENDVVLTLAVIGRIALVCLISYGFYLLFEKPFIKKKLPPTPAPSTTDPVLVSN